MIWGVVLTLHPRLSHDHCAENLSLVLIGVNWTMEKISMSEGSLGSSL